ncbi:hypothetical protein ALO82_200381 [Pseudomonas syringae pv. broussonetiae]|nr:Unknown protein sequence [Pseudomonas amygdali pv. lachrymans]KPW61417.1 hypothetical protein ALO82_200381 [Pseudomonas syringae pv. broussonetiae]
MRKLLKRSVFGDRLADCSFYQSCDRLEILLVEITLLQKPIGSFLKPILLL